MRLGWVFWGRTRVECVENVAIIVATLCHLAIVVAIYCHIGNNCGNIWSPYQWRMSKKLVVTIQSEFYHDI